MIRTVRKIEIERSIIYKNFGTIKYKNSRQHWPVIKWLIIQCLAGENNISFVLSRLMNVKCRSLSIQHNHLNNSIQFFRKIKQTYFTFFRESFVLLSTPYKI